jgi:cytochrome c-type biogenesis protein
MVENITIVGAFIGGLISFISPCVLPMVPVYLASLYGPEIFDVRGIQVPVFLHALSFVVGFSVIFVSLGAIAGMTGYALNPNYALLNKVAGSLLIVFGLFILAALKVPWLNYEKRLTTSLGNTTSYLRSFLIGAIFPLGWIPCLVGILGSILAVASVQATAWQGASLLAVYSLGLGLPFLIIGVAFDSILPLLRRIHRYSRLIYIISGCLLVAVGVLMLTNSLDWFASIAT